MIKNLPFILFLLVICCSTNTETDIDQRKIENVKAFAKVYGYVKYFHPSDEAAALDWKAFSIYGADLVKECNSDDELVEALNSLFLPIAPSIRFTREHTASKYDLAIITPKNLKGYQPAFWQHSGVSKGMQSDFYPQNPYRSVRVNGTIEHDHSQRPSKLMFSLDPTKYRGKKIKYSAWAKFGDNIPEKGYLRLVVEKSDGTTDLKSEPVVDNRWKQYQIITTVDTLATSITIGAALQGKDSLFFDKPHLSFQDDNKWIELPVANNVFESGALTESERPDKWYYDGLGYSCSLLSSDSNQGKKCVLMSYTGVDEVERGQPIFDYAPQFGELIEKPVTDSIYCQIPLVLYSGENGTFPRVDSLQLSNLKKHLKIGAKEPDKGFPNVSWDPKLNIRYSPGDESVRLGNLINTYNVFQHFFPYMEVVDLDWDQELEKAISRSLTDKTGKDHLITLQKFTAALRDGHITVSYKGNRGFSSPGITWEWMEGKLVITNVQDSKIPLSKGDVVKQIDGMTAKDYFKEINSRVSAGTTGYLNHKAESMGLLGEKDTKIIITVNDKKIPLVRNSYPSSTVISNPDFKRINDSVVYLNINKISMDSINSSLPELEKAKSIICDLRYYPNGNHGFLAYLLKENDTTTSWMQIPKNVYPDQEHLIGYEDASWHLTAKQPYLGDKKIIFLTQGSAISYAESYMGYVQGYGLATIIGEPTAGTNGNINPFELPGGYQIVWTGMKVTKQDGSQLFGVGFIPDILVHETIKGIEEGRDEFLEKAIELANQ